MHQNVVGKMGQNPGFSTALNPGQQEVGTKCTVRPWRALGLQITELKVSKRSSSVLQGRIPILGGRMLN